MSHFVSKPCTEWHSPVVINFRIYQKKCWSTTLSRQSPHRPSGARPSWWYWRKNPMVFVSVWIFPSWKICDERYQLPTPHEAVADIASSKAKFFTKFDVLSGYWQCPIDPESRLWRLMHYMDVICPCTSPISEHYNRCVTETLDGIQQIKCTTDDFIVYDDT